MFSELYFNSNLYKEGLRRTKTLGILFIVGMLLGSIAQPLIEISNHISLLRHGWGVHGSLIPIWGLRASYMMIFAPFAGAPVITLSMFSFLNKRSSSDFYHAIPHKRETLFGSFISAIVTWVIGGMWLSSTISVIIFAISPHAAVDIGSVLFAILGMSAASLLVIVGSSLATALTGNTLSNIVVAGLILFLPRILMGMFVDMVVDSTRVVSSANFGILGNYHYNILIGLLNRGLFDPLVLEELLAFETMLYSIILIIVYFVIAGILFKRRKSELAGNPGSKVIQPIIRIAVTFVITLPAIFMITNVHNYSDRFTQLDGIVVIYILAAFCYFLYEFVTMKRIPKITKMIPGLVVVVLLNVIFTVGVNVSRNIILQEVNVGNISSITIEDLNTNQWGLPSYADLSLRGLEIRNNEITDLFGETLNDNIRAFGNDNYQWGNRNEVRVTLNIDGERDVTRNIWIRNMNELNGFLIEYEPYREMFMLMPENPDQFFMWWIDGGPLTQEQLHHIYDVLREEVVGVNFENWHNEVTRNLEGSRGSTYQLEVSGRQYRSLFPITQELTPRTYGLLSSYLESDD